MSLEDFYLYVFRGLRGEFKDLVTSLITKAEPLSYADFHNHLFTHEFLHKNSLHFMDANPFAVFIFAAAATTAANITTLCSSCSVSSQLKFQS
jgi:hypothetical protein